MTAVLISIRLDIHWADEALRVLETIDFPGTYIFPGDNINFIFCNLA
jgi:hypothetical protein